MLDRIEGNAHRVMTTLSDPMPLSSKNRRVFIPVHYTEHNCDDAFDGTSLRCRPQSIHQSHARRFVERNSSTSSLVNCFAKGE